MRRSILAGLLLLAAAVSAPAQRLDREPYLQNLQPDSVEILWRTETPAETWVEVRRAGGGKWRRYGCNVPATAHQIRVPGLKPDTRYEYRAGAGSGKWFAKKPTPFQTFPAGDVPSWSFVVFGDHRNYPKDHRAVVEAILAQARQAGMPRFLIDSGDYTGQGEHKTDFWNEQFFEPERGLIDRVCLFPVIGNHEAPSRIPRIPLRYLENFSVPTRNSGTEYYYSFDFAGAHFCMIDAYASDITTGTRQYEWIRRDLRRSDKMWKFAVLHFPVFVCRDKPTATRGNRELRELLVPLFELYGVSAVFCGDSHFYQRSEVNGVPYICSGGGGAPLYDPCDAEDYVRASKKAHHYCRVNIQGDRMKIDAYDTSNTLIDTLTTGPRSPLLPGAPKLNMARRMPDEKWTTVSSIIVESRLADGKLTSAPAYIEEVALMDSTAKSVAAGVTGTGSRFSDNAKADARVTYTPPIAAPGTYLVSVTVPAAYSADAPNTLVEVKSPGAATIRGRVSLSAAVAGSKWHDVGLFELAPGASVTLIEAEEEPDRFFSDAVKFTLMKAD